MAEQAARKAAVQLSLPVDVSPDQALLDEVQRCAGLVAFYEAKVREIADADPQELVWGVTRDGKDGPVYEAKTNVWLKLWNEERDHLVEVSAATLRAGVEERRVRLVEAEGLLVASVIRRVLDALHLTPEQAALVPTVVPRELRNLTTDSTPVQDPVRRGWTPRVIGPGDAS
ncbi:MAG: hypothetical protein QM804_04060 [Propionicimonas sp.]